jgi:hypothetical protein
LMRLNESTIPITEESFTAEGTQRNRPRNGTSRIVSSGGMEISRI